MFDFNKESFQIKKHFSAAALTVKLAPPPPSKLNFKAPLSAPAAFAAAAASAASAALQAAALAAALAASAAEAAIFAAGPLAVAKS